MGEMRGPGGCCIIHIVDVNSEAHKGLDPNNALESESEISVEMRSLGLIVAVVVFGHCIYSANVVYARISRSKFLHDAVQYSSHS
jgi:hypothetical protein